MNIKKITVLLINMINIKVKYKRNNKHEIYIYKSSI